MDNVDNIVKKLSTIFIKYLKYKKVEVSFDAESIYCFLQTDEDFINFCDQLEIPTSDNLNLSEDIEKVKECLLALSIHIKEDEIENIIEKIEFIKEYNELLDLLYELFLLIIKHFEKINKSIGITWEFFEQLIKKLDKTHSKAINGIKDKLEVTKEDSKSDKDILFSINNLKQEINVEEKIEVIKSKVLSQMDEISNVIETKLKEKEERIKKYVIEFEDLNKDISEYKRKADKLQSHLEKYKMESITDYLTGLYNRKYMSVRLEEEELRAKRLKTTFSLIMVDIDDFKKINDEYGHIVGDYVLKYFSNSLISTLRKIDVAFRYGGEEFLILLPETDLENAKLAAERLRLSIEKTIFKYKDKNINITISQGIAEYTLGEDYMDVVEKADNLLLKAKKLGKNKVVCA